MPDAPRVKRILRNLAPPGRSRPQCSSARAFPGGSRHSCKTARAPPHAGAHAPDADGKSEAKAQVCKAALVELLLRAPYREAVRLVSGKHFTRNGWNVQLIWDEVRRLQLQMHGYAWVGTAPAPDMGGAGINAARPHAGPIPGASKMPRTAAAMYQPRTAAVFCTHVFLSQIAACCCIHICTHIYVHTLQPCPVRSRGRGGR